MRFNHVIWKSYGYSLFPSPTHFWSPGPCLYRDPTPRAFRFSSRRSTGVQSKRVPLVIIYSHLRLHLRRVVNARAPPTRTFVSPQKPTPKYRTFTSRYKRRQPRISHNQPILAQRSHDLALISISPFERFNALVSFHTVAVSEYASSILASHWF